ncbi:MAG: DUF4124 domain-containing protein [Granulosicoccus sp.]
MKPKNSIGEIFRLVFSPAMVLATICSFSSPVSAADTEIYKSIAEDGSVVFTDEPSDGATSFKPKELNIVPPQERKKKPSGDAKEQVEAALKLRTVRFVKIQSPVNDQTYVNPVGGISVTITTGHDGGLPVGHSAQIILDGKVVSTGSGTSFSVPTPHRGTHTLSARVFDASGKLRARSRSVKINVIKSVAGGGG